MKKHTQSRQTGFTLIEVILYLGLSIGMLSLVSVIFVNVLTNTFKMTNKEDLQYNTQFLYEKIRRYVVLAERIESPSKGETSSVLSLAMSDPTKNPTIITVSDGVVMVQEGEELPQALSGESVYIPNAKFSNVTYGEGAGSVRLELPIELPNSGNRSISQASSSVSATINILYP